MTTTMSPDADNDITAPTTNPARRSFPAEQHHLQMSVKLEALREACNQGLLDLEQGRCVTVRDYELDAFIDVIRRGRCQSYSRGSIDMPERTLSSAFASGHERPFVKV